ncbi:DUF6705 family protein [Riemerella anatipestifer]|uniref:DUF6705 family protein n=1 Tax=Riemerella anatipestifer TaxID=34085 RepID=UPI001BDA25B6|nr:DUF6705 family protein [Riemerella anatipestifer]MBT0553194.1 hypothetical protein [Riemerella anatipestifer]
MKKILLLVIVLLLHTNCTAQNVYPLNTSVIDIPKGSYMKDLNNELNPYVGRWKTVYNGKEITLTATKEYRIPFLEYYYQDMIIVRYEIKDINGKILESTLETPLNGKRLMISGFTIEENTGRLICIYYGKQCSLGNGFVYLKKQGNNQLLWSYYPQAILVTSQNEKECKGEIYLPEGENIVFTRQ